MQQEIYTSRAWTPPVCPDLFASLDRDGMRGMVHTALVGEKGVGMVRVRDLGRNVRPYVRSLLDDLIDEKTRRSRAAIHEVHTAEMLLSSIRLIYFGKESKTEERRAGEHFLDLRGHIFSAARTEICTEIQERLGLPPWWQVLLALLAVQRSFEEDVRVQAKAIVVRTQAVRERLSAASDYQGRTGKARYDAAVHDCKQHIGTIIDRLQTLHNDFHILGSKPRT